MKVSASDKETFLKKLWSWVCCIILTSRWLFQMRKHRKLSISLPTPVWTWVIYFSISKPQISFQMKTTNNLEAIKQRKDHQLLLLKKHHWNPIRPSWNLNFKLVPGKANYKKCNITSRKNSHKLFGMNKCWRRREHKMIHLNLKCGVSKRNLKRYAKSKQTKNKCY